MSRRSHLVLAVLVSCVLLSVPALAQRQARTQSESQVKGGEPQPGATQGGITTSETDAQPKFAMDYFVGECGLPPLNRSRSSVRILGGRRRQDAHKAV